MPALGTWKDEGCRQESIQDYTVKPGLKTPERAREEEEREGGNEGILSVGKRSPQVYWMSFEPRNWNRHVSLHLPLVRV